MVVRPAIGDTTWPKIGADAMRKLGADVVPQPIFIGHILRGYIRSRACECSRSRRELAQQWDRDGTAEPFRLPEQFGRDADALLELAGEMALVGKAARQRDLR